MGVVLDKTSTYTKHTCTKKYAQEHSTQLLCKTNSKIEWLVSCKLGNISPIKPFFIWNLITRFFDFTFDNFYQEDNSKYNCNQ